MQSSLRTSLLALLAAVTVAACVDSGQPDDATDVDVSGPADGLASDDASVTATTRTSALLDVPWVGQMPELPRGCEVTSLTMLLRHAGVAAAKLNLAAEIKKVPYFANGLHGNPYDGFVGDMYSFANQGYGVYHGPVRDLAKHYLPTRVIDLTGSAFDTLLQQYVALGHPVWVIANTRFAPLAASDFVLWHTPTGDVKITWHEHSVVIVGFDATHVYINDPLDGGNGKNKRLDRTHFADAWRQMGSQAISLTGAGGPVGSTCAVQGGKLYCGNTPDFAMRAQPSSTSAIVNHLRTSYSYFECWGTGEAQASGNTTWYRTIGDDNSSRGWVPAHNLETPVTLDANPTAQGLPHCT